MHACLWSPGEVAEATRCMEVSAARWMSFRVTALAITGAAMFNTNVTALIMLTFPDHAVRNLAQSSAPEGRPTTIIGQRKQRFCRVGVLSKCKALLSQFCSGNCFHSPLRNYGVLTFAGKLDARL
jgi:hypothetical protein